MILHEFLWKTQFSVVFMTLTGELFNPLKSFDLFCYEGVELYIYCPGFVNQDNQVMESGVMGVKI